MQTHVLPLLGIFVSLVLASLSLLVIIKTYRVRAISSQNSLLLSDFDTNSRAEPRAAIEIAKMGHSMDIKWGPWFYRKTEILTEDGEMLTHNFTELLRTYNEESQEERIKIIRTLYQAAIPIGKIEEHHRLSLSHFFYLKFPEFTYDLFVLEQDYNRFLDTKRIADIIK